MAKGKIEKKDKEDKKFDSLKDKAGPIKKEQLNKMVELEQKKKMEVLKEAKRNVPLMYAALIIIAVAAIAAVLIFMTPSGNLFTTAGRAPVKAGDAIQIAYTGWLENGSVFDSGNFSFSVGANEAIPGVDEAVIGMRVGETKTVTIPPDKAYGYYDENKIFDIPVDETLNRTESMDIATFNQTFGEQPEMNKMYQVEGMAWKMKVISVQNDTIKLSHEPEDGLVFDLKDYVGNVYGKATVSVNGDTIRIHSTYIRGSTVLTVFGQGKIVDINETAMRMDFNHPLASQTLKFEIKLLNMISY
jgi:peptidylprolyl isomerase